MSVHSTRRLALLLSVVVPLLYFQCQPAAVPPPHEKCAPANPHRYKPEIAVDEKLLQANPRVAVVWDVVPENPAEPPFQPSKNPVKITWKTSDPAFKLVVTFDDPSCGVEHVNCDKPGECTAMVKKLDKSVRCTYRMFDGAHSAKKDDDADIVVMPCCS